jgi:type IV pilus assembly protein PilP
MIARHHRCFPLAMVTLAALAACGDPPATTRGVGGGGGSSPSRSASASDGGVESDGGSARGRVLQDIDFTESDRSRDPFRSFSREFIPHPETQGQGIDLSSIKLADESIESLRLLAVIVGVANPYAMVVGAQGAGTIIRRGDLVGRPDTIVTPGENGGPHQVPWRVARIVGSRISRDRNNNLTEVAAEVVFEREDRASLTPTRVERVLSLAPAGEGRTAEGGPSALGPNQPPPLPTLPGGSPFLPPNLSALPPGSRTTVEQSQQGSTTVQSVTTIIPPTPAQPAAPAPQPTTVVVQAPTAPSSAPQPAALPDTPPPVRINGAGATPLSALPR